MAFTIKQGDTSPSLVASLLTPSREAAPLLGASVLFHLKSSRPSSEATTGAAVVVDASAGQVRYDWRTEDTSKAGDFLGEFQVTYLDGTIETFPNDGYIEITIQAELA